MYFWQTSDRKQLFIVLFSIPESYWKPSNSSVPEEKDAYACENSESVIKFPGLFSSIIVYGGGEL